MSKTNHRKSEANSVIGTTIKIEKYNDSEAIRKVTRLNHSFSEYSNEIYNLIIQYDKNLKKAGLILPKIFDSDETSKELTFLCEFSGNDILDMFTSDNIESLICETDYFEQMLQMLVLAKKEKLFVDPHPKNFVKKEKKLTYVDITPPYGIDYFKLRFSIATHDERKILEDFFNCMEGSSLGYHIAGDIIKIDKDNENYLEIIYEKIREYELIQSGYKNFLSRLREIISIEREREARGIFLL